MKKRIHSIDTICMILLLTLFTSLALLLVMIGSHIYTMTVERSEQNMRTRTACAYITNKVRANDVEGGIAVEQIENTSVLMLKQLYEDMIYQNLIFCHNGYIKEIFIPEGIEFDLSYGDDLLEANNMDLNYDEAGRVLTVQITGPDDAQQMFEIALRSEE